MTPQSAAKDLLDCLAFFNDEQRRMGLPPLELADMTWIERQHELDVRVNQVAADVHERGCASMAMLDALGAHVLACKIALARIDEFDITSGDQDLAA